MSLKNTLLESSSQKTRSPIFPCPYSRVSSSQVQLHLDTRFFGNSNSSLIRTKSDSLGFTSYIYCKFNSSKTRSLDHSNVLLPPFSAFHQWFQSRQAISCFVCPKINPQMLCAHLFLAAVRCPIHKMAVLTKKNCFSAWASTLNMVLINKDWCGMFFACGIALKG